jgi:hypothetical protein
LSTEDSVGRAEAAEEGEEGFFLLLFEGFCFLPFFLILDWTSGAGEAA